MKISYNWLRGYLKGEAFEKLSVPQIAYILTSTGLEVDSLEQIEAIPGGLAGVVVGHVLSCVDHPDSDHLHVTTVDVGTEDEPLQIVCGAHNIAENRKVLVATVGTELRPKGAAESFKIKKSRIRGVESQGMICAEDELGIGDDHDGIMVLDDAAQPGTPAIQQLDLQGDWTIEIGLTPNRVDGASHIGVARDIAAYLIARGEKVELVWPSVDKFSADNHALEVSVLVETPQAAPRYAGVTITGLKFGPSPDWMQAYLRGIGLNPHNNLVDITNFVLHEMGQPLHAFDADRIAGGRVRVKTCPEGTPFKTLDGVARKLSENDLCICDDLGTPMCIAGVMGGVESGVSETTKSIFLESACFDPVWVRKTASRQGINSDASFLFERGVDPEITVYALQRAALLYKELAGGVVSSGVIDVVSTPAKPFRFAFSLSRANALIGKDIPRETVLQILAALGVEVECFDHSEGDILNVAVPPYRVDVKREADLAEEILRIYGYNNIEAPARFRSSLSVTAPLTRDKLQNAVSELLTSNGYTEIMSNSLTREAYYDGLAAYPKSECVRILNPLSGDLNVMRQTLIFNALEAITLNTNRRNADLKLYEFGNCYACDEAKKSERGDNLLAPYKESFRLGIAVTGLETQPSWNAKSAPSSFFTLSGMVGKLLARLGFDAARLQIAPTENDLFSEAIAYRLNGKELLQIGAVFPTLLSSFDIKAPVWFVEIDFSHLARAAAKVRTRSEELSRFPSVKRDLALLVERSVTFRKLYDIAFGAEKKILKSVTLFDVYEGDKLPEGKKSYALSFSLEDHTTTLTDSAIDRVMGNLVAQFEKHAGATVRS